MSKVPETLGLYVHIPFCEAKCSYCHFAIDPRRPGDERQERYLQALLREIWQWSNADTKQRADTIYFGGGTPTLLSLGRLEQVVEALGRRFDLSPSAEVTVEANPRDLDAQGYSTLRALGANRLSLGVQSFDDSVLREMGRFHTADDARAAVEFARSAGFASLSIDLILGWTGETEERWQRNLDSVRTLAPDHLSLYVLEVEGKTLLSHRARTGHLVLPEDDLVADLYRATVAGLAAMGIERYEISNFARPGHESRHNGKYWDDVPFLGFGMSAHSYRLGRRWWNDDSFGGYCRALETTGAPIVGERKLSAREHVGEALFTGLRRREGIDLASFAACYDVDPLAEFETPLRDPFAAGLLEIAGDRLRLTARGVLLSNEVFRIFV